MQYSYKELKNAIWDLKKESGKIISNCYYFPKDLQEKIENKSITYTICDKAIVLIEKYEDFDKVMFYFSENCDSLCVEIKPGTICDIVYSQAKPINEHFEKLLLQNDFAKLAENYMIYVDNIKRPSPVISDGYVTSGGPEYVGRAKDIIALWKECFDFSSNDFPSLEKLEELILDKRVVLIFNSKNDLVYCSSIDDISSNTCYWRHVCTSPDSRGKGLSRAGFDFLCSKSEEMGFKRISTYVNSENYGAIKMYKKWGFIFSDKKVLEYYKKEGN